MLQVPICAILTDFGTRDYYVAAMKAQLLRVNPQIQIVDITHEIEPWNILHGAVVLSQIWNEFPEGTVFLCVIDPGVGSSRKRLTAKINNRYYVGPDNGLITLIAQSKDATYTYIDKEEYLHPGRSTTFDGRDVFAPVAGLLAQTGKISQMGSQCSHPILLNIPKPEKLSEKSIKTIIYNIDHYGNIITNLICPPDLFTDSKLKFTHNKIDYTALFCEFYSQSENAQIIAYMGSNHYLEFAQNRERLVDRFVDPHIGDPLIIDLE